MGQTRRQKDHRHSNHRSRFHWSRCRSGPRWTKTNRGIHDDEFRSSSNRPHSKLICKDQIHVRRRYNRFNSLQRNKRTSSRRRCSTQSVFCSMVRKHSRSCSSFALRCLRRQRIAQSRC